MPPPPRGALYRALDIDILDSEVIMFSSGVFVCLFVTMFVYGI